MKPGHDNLDELLERVAAGRLDDLTPAQIAALERHLNAVLAAADRLAGVRPPRDPRLEIPVTGPVVDEWDAVWRAIEAGAVAQRLRTPHRLIRLWQAFAAVAACLALGLLWRATGAGRQGAAVELSNNVVVHELEVFGDASAYVAYAGDESGRAMIWVLEPEDGQGV